MFILSKLLFFGLSIFLDDITCIKVKKYSSNQHKEVGGDLGSLTTSKWFINAYCPLSTKKKNNIELHDKRKHRHDNKYKEGVIRWMK